MRLLKVVNGCIAVQIVQRQLAGTGYRYTGCRRMNYLVAKTTMHYNDLIGSIGVGLILLAYCMNSFSWIPKDGRLFFIMNIVGSALACYASALINYVPFIVLEGTWCLVSVAALIQQLKKTNRHV